MMRRIFLMLLTCVTLQLGAQDVHANFENYVDPFTGDVQFSENLMNLSTSQGFSIPISISYNSNVTTNQKASWVGLGFYLGMGEITRTVTGHPDDQGAIELRERILDLDFSGQSITSTVDKDLTYRGSMSPSFWSNDPNSSYNSIHDIQYTAFLHSPVSYPSQAFDEFSLSSPVFSGNFQLINPVLESQQRYLAGESFTTKKGVDYIPAAHPNDPNPIDGEDESYYSKFQFEEDPTGSNFIRYYTVVGIVNGDFDADDDFIGYKDEAGNAFNYNPTGFAYAATPAYFQEEGYGQIGAFTIYLEDGTKLHYSLPVYNYSERSYEFKHDASGNIDNGQTVSYTERGTTVPHHANSWKLTAITGPNYRDLNNNNIPDQGDRGAWIRYYYSKSTGKLKTRFPYYGTSANGPAKPNEGQEDEDLFYFASTTRFSEDEHYYLDKVESDIETIIFYKDLRDDDFYLEGSAKFPALLLKSIVKYGKSGHSRAKNNTVSGMNNAFSGINSTYQTFRDNTYLQADYATEPDLILQRKVFNYNYSLAPGYYANIGNTSTLTTLLNYNQPYSFGLDPLPAVDDHIYEESAVSGGYGKLTITEIKNYEFGNVQVFGDYDFTYSSFNPQYFPNYVDDGGFYSDRHQSMNPVLENVPTKADSEASAWRLEKITLPSGVQAKFNYENDRYTKNLSAYTCPNPGTIIVPIKSMSISSYQSQGASGNQMKYGTFVITLFNNNDADFLTSSPDRVVNLVSTYLPCSDAQFNASIAGGWSYSSDGTTVSSINDLSIVSGPSNGQITVKARVKYLEWTNFDFSSLSCATNAQPDKMVSFFEIEDPEYVGGGSRVGTVEIRENASATDFYSVAFDYRQGRKGSKASLFYRNNDTLLPGSAMNSINSLPPVTAYFDTKVSRLGADQTIKDYTIYEYSDETMLNRAPRLSISTELSGEIVVPDAFYYAMRFGAIWNLINDEERVSIVPDVVECYVRTVLIEDVLPLAISGGLDITDVDGVASFLANNSSFNYTIDNCPYGKLNGKIKCYRGSVFSNGSFSFDAGLYFKIYSLSDALNLADFVYLKAEYVDRKSLFGKPIAITSYDADGNKIMQSKYEYQLLAKHPTIYYTRSTPEIVITPTADEDYITKLHHVKEYYSILKTTTFSKGQKSVAVHLGINPNNGKVKKVENVNNLGEYHKTEYEYDQIGFRGKISGVNIHTVNDEDYLKIGFPSGVDDQYGYKNITINHTTKDISYAKNSFNGDYSLPNTQPIRESDSYTEWYEPLDQLTQQVLTASNGKLTISQAATATTWDDILLKEQGVKKDGELKKRKVHTLFDRNLKLLEYRLEPEEVYVSHKYANNGRFLFTSLGNCRYQSFTATGFEFSETSNLFEGEVLGSPYRYLPTANDISSAHTGQYVAKVDAGKRVIYYTHSANVQLPHLEAGRTYISSVWVHNSSVGNPYLKLQLNGSIDNGVSSYNDVQYAYFNDAGIEINGWKLLQAIIEVPSNYTANNPTASQNTININNGGAPESTINVGLDDKLVITMESPGGTSYFDDFRFCPIDSELEVRVYDPIRGVITEILDAENRFVRFTYDASNRLLQTWFETPTGVVKVQDNSYLNN